MKVKLVDCGEDTLMFHHVECSKKEGEEYELFPEPTNSNQAEMFCYACHGFLGFDHAIKPFDATLLPDSLKKFVVNYKRVKQSLLEGGYLELGELVVIEADDYTAVGEVLEVDRDHIAICSLRFTIYGRAPDHVSFEVRKEDQP